MGFVQIKENKGEGLYSVEVIKDVSRATKKKEQLIKEIVNLKGFVTGQLDIRLASSTEILNAINADINAVLQTSLQEGKKFDEIEKLLGQLLIEQSEERANNDTLILQKEELEYLITAKKAALKLLQTLLDKKDVRDIWATDYEDEFIVDAVVMSLEINRDNEGILVAPHTYEVAQEDLDLIASIIKIKEDEILRLEENLVEIQEEIENNIAVTAFERTQLTILLTLEKTNKNLAIIDTQKQKVFDLIFEGQRLKQLKIQLIKLIKDKKNKLEKSTIFQTDLTTAKATPEGVFIPKVNKFSTLLQPVLSSSPEAVFFNMAMLPGVQRWRPTYRGAKIKAIDFDKDTCTVLLYTALSRQQNLNINYDVTDIRNGLQPTYENVPIRYGSCNSAVFSVDDDVTVLFKEEPDAKGKALLYEPTVIGFVTKPIPCSGLFYTEIAILGNPYGVKFRISNGVVKAKKSPLIVAGNIDWSSSKEDIIITWRGPTSRYLGSADIIREATPNNDPRAPLSNKFRKLDFRASTYSAGSIPGQTEILSLFSWRTWDRKIFNKEVVINAPQDVLGAWMFEGVLFCCTYENNTLSALEKTNFYYLDAEGFDVNANWILFAEVTHTTASYPLPLNRRSPISVSPSGTKIILPCRRAVYTPSSGTYVEVIAGIVPTINLADIPILNIQQVFYEFELVENPNLNDPVKFNLNQTSIEVYDCFADNVLSSGSTFDSYSPSPPEVLYSTRSNFKRNAFGAIYYPIFRDWKIVNNQEVVTELSLERTAGFTEVGSYFDGLNASGYPTEYSKETRTDGGEVTLKLDGQILLTGFSYTQVSSERQTLSFITNGSFIGPLYVNEAITKNYAMPLFVDLRYGKVIFIEGVDRSGKSLELTADTFTNAISAKILNKVGHRNLKYKLWEENISPNLTLFEVLDGVEPGTIVYDDTNSTDGGDVTAEYGNIERFNPSNTLSTHLPQGHYHVEYVNKINYEIESPEDGVVYFTDGKISDSFISPGIVHAGINKEKEFAFQLYHAQALAGLDHNSGIISSTTDNVDQLLPSLYAVYDEDFPPTLPEDMFIHDAYEEFENVQQYTQWGICLL